MVSIMFYLNWNDICFIIWMFGYDDMFVLEFDFKRLDNIWMFDLFFFNEKSVFIYKVFMFNKMLWVYINGKIIYIVRYKMFIVSDYILFIDLFGFFKIFNFK